MVAIFRLMETTGHVEGTPAAGGFAGAARRTFRSSPLAPLSRILLGRLRASVMLGAELPSFGKNTSETMPALGQRKPAIYLAVIIPILVGGGICLVLTLISVYSRAKGIEKSAIPDLNGILITVPAFLLWIPISLLISNLVLYLLPPLRKVAEAYVTESGRPGFRESQGVLLRALSLLGLVCLPLIVMGFLL